VDNLWHEIAQGLEKVQKIQPTDTAFGMLSFSNNIASLRLASKSALSQHMTRPSFPGDT